MNESVILFSHGSLLCGAGQALEEHASRLRAQNEYSAVAVGYLNYSSPSFGEAVENLTLRGTGKILVAPYFLVSGYFVQTGLPRVLQPERGKFPHIEFYIAPALEDHSLLADVVLASARPAMPSENWRVILHSAPQFCERSEKCPLFEKCRAADFHIQISQSCPDHRSALRAPHSALLMMAHGSPDEKSNAPLFRVAERVRATREYSHVVVAFMECNEPSMPDAIKELVQSGAKQIIAVPYFLHAGKHVADDLPSLLEAARTEYPHVEFLMSDYIGREPILTRVLHARLQEAKRVE